MTELTEFYQFGKIVKLRKFGKLDGIVVLSNFFEGKITELPKFSKFDKFIKLPKFGILGKITNLPKFPKPTKLINY